MSKVSELREYLVSELKAKSTEQNKKTAQRFFKHDIRVYGVRSAEVGQISKEAIPWTKSWTKEEIFELAQELWKSGIMEETFIACSIGMSVQKKFSASDLPLFTHWIDQYIDNWASCDTFCNHTIGTMLMKFPELRPDVISWSKSKNVWMRRASAVSYIVPARKGLYLEDMFEIAEILLLDQEDMVQKGYGWMLKVASSKYLDEVFQYVMQRKAVMPRTALRYAIEKMPDAMKKEAMQR